MSLVFPRCTRNVIDHSDVNMVDPLSTLNDQVPLNTHPSPRSILASLHVQNQERQPRAQTYPKNSQVTVMTSSQATLVPTQVRTQPTPRLTREQARAAEVRAQASSTNASGSGAVQRSSATRILNVSSASVGQVIGQPSEAPGLSRNTSARSRSMEPASVTKITKDAGSGKGRRLVVLGPLIEDENPVRDEEKAHEFRSAEGKRHINQMSLTSSQAGPMMGETNDDEEEVDHLLDEDPSGSVDLNGLDEEVQESEEDAQIQRMLDNPGGGYKVPADEDQHSEEDEDESESESESEDDLTKLQNKAKLRPNPAPNASTSRRYVNLSYIQPISLSSKSHSTDPRS